MSFGTKGYEADRAKALKGSTMEAMSPPDNEFARENVTWGLVEINKEYCVELIR